LFGLDVCDYPNKFAVHSPEVLSGYPTEDGLGFILAWWIAAKIMGARAYMQFVERYAKPGTVATYNTRQNDGKPRTATPEDIAIAQQVVQTMGYGGAPGAAIPDSIELELFGPAAMKGSGGTADPKTFVEWCDDQIARAIRTTSALQQLGQHGSRSALETLVKGANRVAFWDAMGVSSTWTRDIALPITRLNYPALERLCPTIAIHVDDEPGPEVILERVKDLVSVGAPLDADKVAAKIGMADLLVAKGDTEARMLFQAKAIETLPSAQQTIPANENVEDVNAPKNGAIAPIEPEEEEDPES
jgi:phage gp29-like protein